MSETYLREALLASIDGGRAYMTFDEIVSDFPPAHYNTRPPNLSYSFWHLLEHIRICIDRMIDYVEGEEYPPLTWPQDFWPDPTSEANDLSWSSTISAIRSGIARMRVLATEGDPGSLARHADGNQAHTLAHELIDVAEHNAYHLGEFAVLRQVMGIWPEDHA